MASIDPRVNLVLQPVAVQAGPYKDSFDASQEDALHALVRTRVPECDASQTASQRQALLRLKQLFEAWAAPSPVLMFCSGSFRLNVHSASTDIDVLFMTTAAITRDAVFDGFVKILQSCADVSNLLPVRNSRVPLIGLTLGGQEFDVLTCHLNCRTLPTREAVLSSYEWMNGLPEADVLAFNGPRVTEMIPNVAKVAGIAFSEAQLALRFLRHWAKQRCVYGNKSGFMGGVNLALMLCYVMQRAEKHARAPTLIARFFDTFAKWPLDTPVELDAHMGHACPVWLSQWEYRVTANCDPFTVLTPCFPRFNTMAAVTKYSAKTMRAEFVRAARIVEMGGNVQLYDALCAPLKAIDTCTRFLCICAQTPDTLSGIMWLGFIEARVRHLVTYLHEAPLAIKDFRFIPTWVESRHDGIVRRCVYITANDDGIKRPFKVSGNLDVPLQYFIKQHVMHGPCARPPDASIVVTFVYSRSDMPPSVLHTLHAPDDAETQELCDAALRPVVFHPVTRVKRDGRKGDRGAFAAPLQTPRLQPAPIPKLVVHMAAANHSTKHSRITRPVLCNGVWTPFDVYVGRRCVVGNRVFDPAAFALPKSCTDADAYVRMRVQTDATFGARVSELFGKCLACWCPAALRDVHVHPDLQILLGMHAEPHARTCPGPALIAEASRLHKERTAIVIQLPNSKKRRRRG